jgi:outer membrane protein assembly factor BamE (lipoprotein component of BamABCDE complex)
LCAVGVVLSVGCAAPQGPFVKANYTQQDVENIKKLSTGMEKAQIIALMGEPVRTEFAADVEAWHYCRTGPVVDEFAVVILRAGKSIQARNYTVVVTGSGSEYEDCPKFVRATLR